MSSEAAMRYREITEAVNTARQQSEQDKRKRAHDRIAAANRKRAEADRRYQDELEASRETLAKAKAALQNEGTKSHMPSPAAASLLDDRRSYELRDGAGRLLGWLEPRGEILQAKDSSGTLVGWYDGRSNQTRDRAGRLVGSGDLLAALLLGAR